MRWFSNTIFKNMWLMIIGWKYKRTTNFCFCFFGKFTMECWLLLNSNQPLGRDTCSHHLAWARVSISQVFYFIDKSLVINSNEQLNRAIPKFGTSTSVNANVKWSYASSLLCMKRFVWLFLKYKENPENRCFLLSNNSALPKRF